MQKLAEDLKHENSLLVFGRGYNYATALEAALKVSTQELSQPDQSVEQHNMGAWIVGKHHLTIINDASECLTSMHLKHSSF